MTALSRRHLLAGATALAATSISSRALAQETATPEASPVASGLQADGSWVFTDDRGVTIHTDALPTKIIAQTTSAAALWDFGIKPIGIFGPSRSADGAPDIQAGDLDLDAVEILGDYGAYDLEKAISLGADLYIDVDRGAGLWYVDAALEETLLTQFPTLAITAANVPVTTTIAHFESLAGALGADLDAPEIADAKSAWVTAEAEFKALLAAKPGLKILGASPGEAEVYVLNPPVLGDLSYYTSLGADFIVPENPTASTSFNFELMSWEQFGQYASQADLILLDRRSDTTFLDNVEIWNTFPAVQAGQVGTWYGVFSFSYKGLGDTLNLMIEQVTAADAGIVS